MSIRSIRRVKPKKVQIAGPYRADTLHGVHENIQYAGRIAATLWKMGFDVFCPHLNSAYMDGIVPDERFLNYCLREIPDCDCLVLLDGWKNSSGTLKEIERAKELGKPVFHFSLEVLAVRAFAKSLTWRQTQDVIRGTAIWPANCANCGWRGPSNMLNRSEYSGDLKCPCCQSENIDEWE